MNDIESLTRQYLETRRALGYQLKWPGLHLPKLAALVRERGMEYLSANLAFEWAADNPSGSAKQTARRLSWARLLAHYLAAHDPRTELPSREMAPLRTVRSRPHIFSDDEVLALMSACERFQPFKGESYRTLIGLLAVTGMRVGELIALDRDDIDHRRRTLTVRSGKAGKARRLLLSLETCEALHRYGRLRDRTLRMPSSNALLLSGTGRRLIYKNVHHGFHRLVEDVGLGDRQPRPRPHDLRHTFAVETLRRWYAEEREIEPRLAALATWLGHVAPSSTYWYLTATPELLQLARARAERRATARGAHRGGRS